MSNGQATAKRPESKMQQLLALARERLHEQQTALIERDATIRNLRNELLEAQASAASPSSKKLRSARSQEVLNYQNETEEKPLRAWCQVDERLLGLSSIGRWVLFEWDDSGNNGKASGNSLQETMLEAGPLTSDNPQTASQYGTRQQRYVWQRFQDVARLEDYVRRDPGSEPLILPEPVLTVAEGRDIREKAEVAVAHINDELTKLRVQTELQKKRRDELERENRETRRELLRLQTLESPASKQEDEISALQDRLALTEAENLRLKRQLETDSSLTRRDGRHRIRTNDEHETNNTEEIVSHDTIDKQNEIVTRHNEHLPMLPPSPAAADAALAAQWRQRYEGIVAQRDKLASQVRSLSAADANSSEYASLNRQFQDLQREYKQYRSNALKAMRLQEQQIKAAELKAEKKNLDALGNRDNKAPNDFSQEARPLSPDDAKAKLQYLKNLMAKYLATAQPQPKEHMERAILMVLGFSQDEKAAIAQQHRAAAAASSSASSSSGGGFFFS